MPGLIVVAKRERVLEREAGDHAAISSPAPARRPFLAQLTRRKVIRVAIACAVAPWS
jgi:hypothetical protein